MALQPFLKINTFTGASKDNFDEFERLLRAAINVGQIAGPQQAPFLQLNLSGGALNFYSSLAAAVRNDLDQALTALRNRYNQVANQEFHRIKFQERKFDSVKESPEDYIVDLQRLALRAFPNIPAGAGGAPPAIDRADERTRRVKEAFIQGMPIKYKKKLLKEPPERTVDDLGRIITKELWILSTYPDDSFPAAFQQLTTSEEETPMAALNLLQNQQIKMHDDLNKKIDAMSNRLNQGQRDNNFSRGRGQFRGGDGRGHGRGSWNNYNGRYGSRNYGNRFDSPGYRDRGFNRARPGSPHPNRRWFCNRCGKYGHTPSNCWSIPTERNNGQSIPFDRSPKN